MLKFPILKKMVRKPTSKTKNEDEVESPKTPVTPEFIGDDVVSSPISPTFTTIEHEDTKIWSSSFSWNMQTTSSEFDNTTMSNVWEEHNSQLDDQSDITKKDEIIENKKDDFEENVWTDVQVVAGMPNNQLIFSVPFVVPDSPTISKSQVDNVSTISKNDESIPSHQERDDDSEDSNEITNSENFDYVDLGRDNISSSKELSKEFDIFTNSDVKLELNNNKFFNESKDLYEQYENENPEKIVVNEDDFGAFECSEENESNFDDFSEFKIENTNDIDSCQGNEKSSSDNDDDFDDFKNDEKNEKISCVNNLVSQKGLSPDLEDFMVKIFSLRKTF